MLGPRSVLAIIAARGGSKGLPGKNVALCGGKPVIAWSVEAAKAARLVDRTIVTSDDAKILAVAREAGAEVLVRPAELATDEATMDGVVLHALEAASGEGARGYDVAVLLQATSPLRVAEDIDGALETLERTGSPSVVGVTEVDKSPYWMHSLGPDGRLRPLFPEHAQAGRRQELPTVYVLNGAVYAFDVAWFRRGRRFTTDESVGFVMPKERSVDVDAARDLALAHHLFSERASRPSQRAR
jgi:N-acylneuraminate cytidylyltransferase